MKVFEVVCTMRRQPFLFLFVGSQCSSGLSGGAIAGIVVGVLVGVFLMVCVVGVVCFRRRKNGKGYHSMRNM